MQYHLLHCIMMEDYISVCALECVAKPTVTQLPSVMSMGSIWHFNDDYKNMLERMVQ